MPEFGNSKLKDQHQKDTSRHYDSSMEELLGSIISRLINVNYDDLDDIIHESLQIIGNFVEADRAYLFLFSDFNQAMSNISEWCAEGISTEKNAMQNLPLKNYTWLLNELARSDYFYVSSPDEVPESAQIVKGAFGCQESMPLLQIPFKVNQKLVGFLGFDAVKKYHILSSKEINALTIVTNILLYAKGYKKTKEYIRIGKQLLGNIEEGVFVIRHPDILSWANQTFFKITGYQPEEVISRQHQFLNLFEVDRAASREMHAHLFEHGRWHGILNGKHKDGHTYPASVSVITTWDREDNITRELVIIQDLTEHNQLIKEREKLHRQTLTAQKLNSLSTMSAGLVHEIAQPLNSISVLVDGMLYCHQNNYYLPESEIFEKLGEMSAEINRIDEIIKHIRSFASLNQSADLCSCDWNDAVERAHSLLGRQLATHEILVTNMLEENLLPVSANPNRLDEILVNLLVNSMQSLDQCSKNDKEIICRTYQDDSYSILEIADNGTGIDENLLETIFDPFFSSKAPGQGMGLGLSIVESIMNSFNGQIKVYNNEKGGATFRLKLPIIRDV